MEAELSITTTSPDGLAVRRHVAHIDDPIGSSGTQHGRCACTCGDDHMVRVSRGDELR